MRRLAGLHLFLVCVTPLMIQDSDSALDKGWNVREIGEDELVDAARDAELDLDPAEIRAARSRGDFCVAAFDHDVLAGYVWRAFGPTPVAHGIEIDFPAGQRYSYKLFVRRRYRGRRLARALAIGADRLCVERRDCRDGIAYIESHNFASLRSQKLREQRIVGAVGYIALGRWHWPFRTPGARRAGVALRRATAGA